MASWDTGAPNVKLLEEGVLTETVAQQPYVMGQLAIQQIADKLTGKPTRKVVASPVSILTSAAVDTPAGRKLWYKADCSS